MYHFLMLPCALRRVTSHRVLMYSENGARRAQRGAAEGRGPNGRTAARQGGAGRQAAGLESTGWAPAARSRGSTRAIEGSPSVGGMCVCMRCTPPSTPVLVHPHTLVDLLLVFHNDQGGLKRDKAVLAKHVTQQQAKLKVLVKEVRCACKLQSLCCFVVIDVDMVLLVSPV